MQRSQLATSCAYKVADEGECHGWVERLSGMWR